MRPGSERYIVHQRFVYQRKRRFWVAIAINGALVMMVTLGSGLWWAGVLTMALTVPLMMWWLPSDWRGKWRVVGGKLETVVTEMGEPEYGWDNRFLLFPKALKAAISLTRSYLVINEWAIARGMITSIRHLGGFSDWWKPFGYLVDLGGQIEIRYQEVGGGEKKRLVVNAVTNKAVTELRRRLGEHD